MIHEDLNNRLEESRSYCAIVKLLIELGESYQGAGNPVPEGCLQEIKRYWKTLPPISHNEQQALNELISHRAHRGYIQLSKITFVYLPLGSFSEIRSVPTQIIIGKHICFDQRGDNRGTSSAEMMGFLGEVEQRERASNELMTESLMSNEFDPNGRENDESMDSENSDNSQHIDPGPKAIFPR